MATGSRGISTRLRIEDVPSVDLARLRQARALVNGLHSDVAGIECEVAEEHIELYFRRAIHRVYCTYKTHGFGGQCRWLVCPDCERACRAVFVLGGRVSCRLCLGLRYSSQLEPAHHRALRRRDRIWHRLNGPRRASFDDAFPPKPRWMRWSRYLEFKAHYERLDRKAWIGAAIAMGLV